MTRASIISSREQRKQFDAAVKDVMRRRKAAQAASAGQDGGGGSRRQTIDRTAQHQAKLAALVNGDKFAQLKEDQRRKDRGQGQGGGGGGSSSERLGVNSRRRERRRSSNLSASVTGGGTYPSTPNGYDSEGLQNLRAEHPYKAAGGTTARRRSSYADSVVANPPSFEGRRSSAGDCAKEDPEARRSSWNRSASFRSSLNQKLMLDNGLDSPPSSPPRSPHQTKKVEHIPRVTSAGSMTMYGIGRMGRSGRNALAASLGSFNDSDDNVGNGNGSSSGNLGGSRFSSSGSLGDALLVPTYRPKAKNGTPSSSFTRADSIDEGRPSLDSRPSLRGRGNAEWEDLNQMGPKSSQRRITTGELKRQTPSPIPVLAPSSKDVPSPRKLGQAGGLDDQWGGRVGSQRRITTGEVKAGSLRRISSGEHMKKVTPSLAINIDKIRENALALNGTKIKDVDKLENVREASSESFAEVKDAAANGQEAGKEGNNNNNDISNENDDVDGKDEWFDTQLDLTACGSGGSCGVEYKLEDLVPTRKTISRENSEDLAAVLKAEMEEGGAAADKDEAEAAPSKGNKDGKPNRRPSMEMVDQWKKQELRLEPAQVDFNLGQSKKVIEVGEEAARDAEIEAWFSTLGEGETQKRDGGMGGSSKEPSFGSLSFKTAQSREPSHSPARPTDVNPADDDSDCPRSQFVLLKSQQKSQSGNTGKTQGTSSSSLLSSDGTIDNPAKITSSAKSGSPGETRSSIEPIKEEVKDIGDSMGERREVALGDSYEAEADPMPGFSSYKKKRSTRIKRIRKGIKKSIMGDKGESNSSVDSSGRQQRGAGYGEVSSHCASSISGEQQERLSRHLQRKNSSRSMSSVYSTLSGITGKSDASSKNGSRWSRFNPMKKAQSMRSMSNLMGSGYNSGNSGSSSRNILVKSQRGSASSSISGLSNRSVGSLNSNDSAFAGRFTDFYDHGDHAKAVSVLMASKSTSARSLGTPLATVKEPADDHERGEQKHDEDYHHDRNVRMNKQKSAWQCYLDNSERSEDTVNSFYRHPSHEHLLVHMRPNQLFPDTPGWQCDECTQETFDLTIWAYISTEKNYLLCEHCFAKRGFSVAG